mgnify:CR=1 FL=1
MKKFASAFAIALTLQVGLVLALTSCSSNQPKLDSSRPEVAEDGTTVRIIRFEGHEYLVFDGPSYEGGVCHSESCPCKTK